VPVVRDTARVTAAHPQSRQRSKLAAVILAWCRGASRRRWQRRIPVAGPTAAVNPRQQTVRGLRRPATQLPLLQRQRRSFPRDRQCPPTANGLTDDPLSRKSTPVLYATPATASRKTASIVARCGLAGPALLSSGTETPAAETRSRTTSGPQSG